MCRTTTSKVCSDLIDAEHFSVTFTDGNTLSSVPVVAIAGPGKTEYRTMLVPFTDYRPKNGKNWQLSGIDCPGGTSWRALIMAQLRAVPVGSRVIVPDGRQAFRQRLRTFPGRTEYLRTGNSSWERIYLTGHKVL